MMCLLPTETEDKAMIGKGNGEGSTVTQFKPGKPKTGGRPPGGLNRTAQDIKEQAQGYAAEAVETLVQIMRDDAVAPQTRVNAINALLDRAMGKPRQEIEQVGAVEPMQIVIKHWHTGENDLPPDAA